jgi:proteasome lid subunit RPN8/RPN11
VASRENGGGGMEISAPVTITLELAEKIRAHGAETYPHECCGALLGREELVQDQKIVREIVALCPLVNRRDDSPRNRFSVTSEDVREAEKAATARDLEVVGWYHSHPDHPARPSEFDREHAWPWYSYVIVSVTNGRPENMTSWRLNDDREEFSSETIEVRDVRKGAVSEGLGSSA